MRDLSLLLILLGLVSLAWWRPWLGVMGLAFIGGMHPQGYAGGFMKTFPIYMTLFAVVALAAARDYWRWRAWPRLPIDWRLLLILLIWGQFVLSTSQAINPWAAWPKMWEVAKLLPPLVLILLLIDSREKLLALNLTMALSVAVVVFKGGYWAVMTGFQDRVYGPPDSQYGDNNEFAVATAMAIPLLVLWYRETGHHALRLVLAGMIALSFASALSSWSRGGLLSLGVVALLLIWHSRRKWLALPLLAVGVGLMFVNLPQEWFVRMGALGAGELDASALSRLEVWRLGWAHALERPWFGGGFQGWVYLSLPTGGLLDWHSAYVEMAAEHGLLGLALWGALLLGSMLALTVLIGRGRRERLPWLENHAAMLRASLAAYMVGAAFLGIAYWQMLYLIIVSTVLLRRFSAQSEFSMQANSGREAEA
jgi:probable O-glycosylation ligase (exosortase A-associated)